MCLSEFEKTRISKLLDMAMSLIVEIPIYSEDVRSFRFRNGKISSINKRNNQTYHLILLQVV